MGSLRRSAEFDTWSPAGNGEPPSLAVVARWPSVIGIISIILGSLGLMCWGSTALSGLGLVSQAPPPSAVAPNPADAVTPEETAGEESSVAADPEAGTSAADATSTASTPEWVASPVDVGIMVSSTVASIWLLVSGIGMVRRRPGSAKSLRAWSIVKILLVVGWIAAAYPRMSEVAAAFRAEAIKGDPEIADIPVSVFETGLLVTYVIVGAILIIWPIILLVFLRGPGIRDEVNSWSVDPRNNIQDLS